MRDLLVATMGGESVCECGNEMRERKEGRMREGMRERTVG